MQFGNKPLSVYRQMVTVINCVNIQPRIFKKGYNTDGGQNLAPGKVGKSSILAGMNILLFNSEEILDLL